MQLRQMGEGAAAAIAKTAGRAVMDATRVQGGRRGHISAARDPNHPMGSAC